MATATDTRALSLALRIRVARVGAGFTQAELAARLGVARSTLTNWERGGNDPQLGDAVRLAQMTGVTLEWLAEGVGVNENTPVTNDEGEWRAPRDSNPRPSDP